MASPSLRILSRRSELRFPVKWGSTASEHDAISRRSCRQTGDPDEHPRDQGVLHAVNDDGKRCGVDGLAPESANHRRIHASIGRRPRCPHARGQLDKNLGWYRDLRRYGTCRRGIVLASTHGGLLDRTSNVPRPSVSPEPGTRILTAAAGPPERQPHERDVTAWLVRGLRLARSCRWSVTDSRRRIQG